jgi:hypothetical protein
MLNYAEEMKGVDLGWLSGTLDVSANDLFLVKRPADIAALSITLLNMPSLVPNDWFFNLCRKVVAEHAPKLDSIRQRITSQSSVIRTIKALRITIVSGRFGADPLVPFLERLSDSDAIDLMLGQSFYLEQRKPILGARDVMVERGAGFYFDQCLVVRSKHETAVILTDSVGNRYRDFYEEKQQLAMFLTMPNCGDRQRKHQDRATTPRPTSRSATARPIRSPLRATSATFPA